MGGVLLHYRLTSSMRQRSTSPPQSLCCAGFYAYANRRGGVPPPPGVTGLRTPIVGRTDPGAPFVTVLRMVAVFARHRRVGWRCPKPSRPGGGGTPPLQGLGAVTWPRACPDEGSSRTPTPTGGCGFYPKRCRRGGVEGGLRGGFVGFWAWKNAALFERRFSPFLQSNICCPV